MPEYFRKTLNETLISCLPIDKNILRRPKKSFPSKRGIYKKYKNTKWNCTQIFEEVDKLKANGYYNYLNIVSEKYGI